MNYGVAEKEIADRINARFAELGKADFYFAAPMPDTEKEAREFEAEIQKTRVAVEYIDSTYKNDTGSGHVRQEETVKFRLLFDGRKMRGEGGLFTMIDFVKKFLIGFRLTDCDPLTIAEYGKLHYEQGVWMPYLDVQCGTLNVQTEIENDEIGGVFKGLLDEPINLVVGP